MSTPAVQPQPRTESFAVTGDTVELELQLGTGSVSIELVNDLEVIDVALDVGAGTWWQQGLTGVLSMFGTSSPEHPEMSDTAFEALAATEIAFSAQRSRMVLRAPRAGAVRAVALNAQVRAPSGARVLVRSSSARVEVVGTATQVDVSTGSGDVNLHKCAERVDIRTGTGDVSLGELRQGGRVRTGSGDITVDAVSGDLDLVSGSGDLRIGIAAGVLAELDVNSGSGTARSDLEVLETAPGDGPTSSNNPVLIRARTGSGTVLVHGER